jgi:DNA repair exonuclease SbcCD ATPase subunit
MSFAFDIQGQMDALTQEIDALQKRSGGPQGYRLRRIILANFWLYSLQVFEIPHGRLLLAGNNATGKSTVMTAALPLALEGNLRPERLDTFGGKHKHAEYYVLGDENSELTKRTSYVALEFEWRLSDTEEEVQAPKLDTLFASQQKQPEKAQYLTIGISLYGNKTATTRIQPMYFLITDGSRLLKDIQLTYDDKDGQKRTYGQHDFKESLKGHGVICDTQEKYAREVSARLFGFDNPGRFRKLIELLLVLRRPNPSDGLTVDSVQQHMRDALPGIPGDVVKEAVETIGEIENLQEQIEQLNQEHQAVSELHHAQQHLALSKAKNAGCDYKISYQAVEQLDNQIAGWHRELADLEVQHQQATKKDEEIRAKKEQTAGRITAIEMGESIKAAEQVVEAQGRVESTREQVEKQQQSLERAQHRQQIHENRLTAQNERFDHQMEDSEQHIQDLRVCIEEIALWYEVAEQFQQALEQMGNIDPKEPDVVKHIQQVMYLTKIETAQRLKLLQELDRLHQEKENLEQSIERAQVEENYRSREAERFFSQFKAEYHRFYALSHQIRFNLENIVANTDDTNTDTLISMENTISSDEIHILEEDASFDDIDDTHRYVEQCAVQLQQYEQYSKMIVELLSQPLQNLKCDIDNILGEKAQQQQILHAKEQKYSEKQAEPEILPEQPERRKIARKKLAEQHIQAFPFYSLVDLAPQRTSEEAGYIEYLLEDTGLLDALVMLDEDVPQADRLLQEEGLSDYRLNKARMQQVLADNAMDISDIPAGRWLRCDPTMRDVIPETYAQWEATVNELIPFVEMLLTWPPSLLTDDMKPATEVIDVSSKWQHGLLTGQSCKGKVQFIGKMARQQARQQELAALASEIDSCKSKLEKLTQQLTQREAQYDKFSNKQNEIRTLLETMGLLSSYKTLENTATSLNNAHKNYKEAQEQTRKKRQEQSRLTTRLIQQSGPMLAFTHEREKVQKALSETNKLESQTRLLQRELESLITLYEEIQETRQSLQEAQFEVDENQASYAILQGQLTRYNSVLEGLQEIVNSPEAKDLIQKLQVLRGQAKQLDEDILTITKDISTFEERTRALSETVNLKVVDLQTAQVDMRQKQQIFKDLLTLYPVHELQEACKLFDEGQYLKTLQFLQINISAQEQLHKELLRSQGTLDSMHRTHMSTLHEYGPDRDAATFFVTFSQVNGTTPSELLSLLDADLKQQRNLLKQEEIRLFEGFLLRRMAEVLHKYIQEAKEWVGQMNKPLQAMSTVKDHYELEWHVRKPQAEENKFGSYLAKQQKLFNKPLAKLNEEDREQLKTAFKQEIHAVLHNQDEQSRGMNFEQRLQKVFDYREWFEIRVYVTPEGGQKTLLTNQELGKRSGAERLFSLLVPLLAAVAALYNCASATAPRLLALDEAFDRASADNMKQFIEYLARQDFQWIMTGPQLNISGTQIPACVRYLMLHEKGSMTATAVPKIWQSNQTKKP